MRTHLATASSPDMYTVNGELTAAIRLGGIVQRFGELTAIDNLNLSIGAGEVVALLGPNGAGKTSLLDIVLGLARPSAGQVQVFGASPHRAISAGLVSAVMQSGGLLKDLTVTETVRYTASLFAGARPVAEVLDQAGISAIGNRSVGKCSGGEQQRLRFAMALLPNPRLLILDEPTMGMDVEGRRAFWQAVRQEAARGRAVLFATHLMEEADAYADRVVVMRRGKIVADGSAGQLRSMAAGRVVRATLHDADADALRAALPDDEILFQGDTVLVHSRHADNAARYLLTSTTATDVQIEAPGLEDAYLALTGVPSAENSGARR